MSKQSLISRTLLISLVRQRPAIWDKTKGIYKSKRAKAESWRDICIASNKEYERWPPNQRREYFNQLIRTWTHIRDSWMKSMKDKRNQTELTRPYIYHEQLSFLKKIFKPNVVYENKDFINEIEQQDNVGLEAEEGDVAGTSDFSVELKDMIEDDTQRKMSKKTLLTDRVQLINLVRDRPAIWDKTMDIYKNKRAKREAWREICCIMNEYFEKMTHSRRHEYFKLIVSIWTQVRDTWMRSVKNRSSRPYKYHEKLLFLKKVVNSPNILQNIESFVDNEQDITMDDENESVDTSCSSKRQILDKDRETTYFMDSQQKNPSVIETEDRYYSFFKSIQPTLSLFNDDQFLQFQAGTISLLQRIKTEHSNEIQQYRILQRSCEDAPLLLDQDPIKVETVDIT